MKNRRFYLVLAIVVLIILLYRFIASAYFIGKKAGIDEANNRCQNYVQQTYNNYQYTGKK